MATVENEVPYVRYVDAYYENGAFYIITYALSNKILRIDCNKAEEGLKTTPCSECALNALAIDEPLEYARL